MMMMNGTSGNGHSVCFLKYRFLKFLKYEEEGLVSYPIIIYIKVHAIDRNEFKGSAVRHLYFAHVIKSLLFKSLLDLLSILRSYRLDLLCRK